MPIFQNIRSCVRRKHGVTRRPTKVHFNVNISHAFKSENVASQLRDLLVYIAREGVAVTDLFRRPGNPRSIKKIIADLEAGQPINWTEYNFYTLANIAKRFLLSIEGGILGEAAEEALIKTLEIVDVDARYSAMHAIIAFQPKIVQQLLTLLFGTWFRMIYHTEVNAMSVETVAKSVAGSIFPSCTYSLEKVEQASKVMEVLIVGFASMELFGRELIEYFTNETKTSISRTEKFKYEFRFPKYVPRPHSSRMFLQMLMEESRKHGFDIEHDEVTREEFELVHQPMVSSCCPQARNNDQNSVPFRTNAVSHAQSTKLPSSNASSIANPIPVENGVMRTSSMRPPLTTLQHLPPPASMYFTNPNRMPNYNGDTSDLGIALVDRVEQLSEKRTCILAPSNSHYRQVCTDDNNTQFEDSFSDIGDLTDMKSFVDGAVALQGGCFNSVKRRQLERLQQRSDWFLSPPSGLRNSGLMRFEPTSPETHRNTSKIYRSLAMESSLDVSRQHRLCTSPEIDSLDVTLRADEKDKVGSFDQLRRKTSHRHTLLVEEHNYAPSASKQFSMLTPPPPNLKETCLLREVNETSTASDSTTDEDVVEIRYFIAVKYYGPEPRSQIDTQTTLASIHTPSTPLSRVS